MTKLSAVILTKNEEANIERCLKSVQWADEIVVLDDYSTDATREIAKRYGAKVIEHALEGNFAQQRNFGLKQANNEWVVFLDADEVVSEALAKELANAITSDLINGFMVKRVDYWHEKELKGGEWGNMWLLRLGRKGSGQWKRKVHEYWDINDNVGKLKNSLQHFPHQTIREFVNSINFHSQLHAIENERERKNPSYFRVLLSPFAKFIQNFILRGGYRDGVHGFVFSILMSFHSFLAWNELWLKKNSKNYK